MDVALHSSLHFLEISYIDTPGEDNGVIMPLTKATSSHCIANFLSGIAIGKNWGFVNDFYFQAVGQYSLQPGGDLLLAMYSEK